MERGSFGPDCFLSGDPDQPDPTPPTETETFLAANLNPDMVALEGLDRLTWIEPGNPEAGFRLKTDEELRQ